ncbi:OPT oligopeptide transporter [Atractiella rhizophila]|nr:OPT oligopeptide transporter [Atractiella rhizophila]
MSIEKDIPIDDADVKDLHGSRDEKGLEALDVAALPSQVVLADDLEYAAEHVKDFDYEEARDILKRTIADNELDPNFPQPLLQRARQALSAHDLSPEETKAVVEEIKIQVALMDDSPYPEVRAVVANSDDPTLPTNTFRVWFMVFIFSTIGTGINTFFAARYPTISVGVFSAQLLAYPLGKAMEKWLPTTKFNIFGHECSLNPGPFNHKEHMLLTIGANVSFGQVYVTDIFLVQRLPRFFNDNKTGSKAGYQILCGLSTQLMGYAVAGLSRRFLVYPPSMIWYSNLAQIALNKTFHTAKNPVVNGWKISPYSFFLVAFFAYGIYFILPDVFFAGLSQFNWPTWFAKDNVNLSVWLGSAGGANGLGLNPFPTFDWNWLGMDPIVTPLFSYINTVAGMVVLGLPTIAVWYTNTWETGYLPPNSNTLFDRYGNAYNVSRILNAQKEFDPDAYNNYSPAYWGAANVLIYFWFFAFYTASMVHAGLYHWKSVRDGFRAMKDWRNPQTGYNDLHNRLMRAYPEVPEWWFASVGVVSITFGIIFNEVYNTGFPIWAIFFCLVLAFVFVIPAGMIVAQSNILLSLNVISELIGGFALPGKPLANMLFKSYGLLVTDQALTYAADLKLGHYLKINPRHQFWVQTIATVWATFVSIAVIDWQIGNIHDLCSNDQKNHFYCYGYRTFFSAAVIWGVIGPRRIYGSGGIYHSCTYGFLLGALIPIPFYLLARRYPNSWVKYIHTPVLMSAPIGFAPTNLSQYLPGLYICFLFNSYIKKRFLPWWSKYAYVLATALSTAIGIFGVIYFFALQFPSGLDFSWWGNDFPYEGCDANGCGRLTIPDEGFGPAVGEFHA